ncbi:MAG: hypothetical protein ACPIB5_05990, partial [Flavobacteriaceae bacterium]
KNLADYEIMQEYFMKELFQTFKAGYEYDDYPEISEEFIRTSFEKTLDFCGCFPGSRYYEGEADQNVYGIDFKSYASSGNFFYSGYRYWIENFIDGNDYTEEFFLKKNRSYLREAGIKKKKEQMAVYADLLAKRQELGQKLAEYYSNLAYEESLNREFMNTYPLLFTRRYYAQRGDETIAFIKKTISPLLKAEDKALLGPEYLDNELSPNDIAAFKKSLKEKNLVFFRSGQTKRDGLNDVFIGFNNKMSKRAEQLAEYFGLENSRFGNMNWRYAIKPRVIAYWWEDLTNEFTLNNFLAWCGKELPSKSAFEEDNDLLKDLVSRYMNILVYDVGGKYTSYDRANNMYPKDYLYKNIVENHYGTTFEELEAIKEAKAKARKERLRAEVGPVIGNSYYKVNARNQFEYISFFWDFQLKRDVNHSDYWGSYKKIGNNKYEITLTDERTGITLPSLNFTVSADGKKLYLGGDSVPYIIEETSKTGCLFNKPGKHEEVYWKTSNGNESFEYNRYSEKAVWNSTISGGISATGSLYRINDRKVAFVIHYTSWGGKVENNLVVITTSADCNTIYYGVGKKPMYYSKTP